MRPYQFVSFCVAGVYFLFFLFFVVWRGFCCFFLLALFGVGFCCCVLGVFGVVFIVVLGEVSVVVELFVGVCVLLPVPQSDLDVTLCKEATVNTSHFQNE